MRKDYRHFGARSTVKIGPAKRHHTAGHHVMAKTDLRAGIVKARRPRARAGGAKRRALHGAEHRTNINCVMASASNVAIIVDTFRTSKWATNERSSGPGFPARAGQDCPEDLSSVPRAHVDLFRGDSGTDHQTRGRPTQDTDSHGVSDPSGHAQGPFQRAHRGRSRHGFLLWSGHRCLRIGRQRAPPIVLVSRAHGATCGRTIGYRQCCREFRRARSCCQGIFSDALGGTTSISEVVPQVVLCC